LARLFAMDESIFNSGHPSPFPASTGLPCAMSTT
jgi:hypothetical protein